MSRFFTSAHMSRLPLIVLLVMLSVTLFGLAKTPISVSAEDKVCHAVMVLDRSKSVGPGNLQIMREQILKLFDRFVGIKREDIFLAFWSFSADAASENYDAPFNGYAASNVASSSQDYTDFEANLNSIISDGATNYEQGLGFDNGIPNPNSGIQAIMNDANIIVFMSDGLPNTPTNETNRDSGPDADDQNPYPREVARQAVLKLQSQGKVVIGGIIGAASQSSLNYTINGNTATTKDTFRIENYNDFKRILQDQITEKCKIFLPPDSGTNYNLTPAVTNTSGGAVSSSGSAVFHYNVDNTVPAGLTSASTPVNWSIKQLIVDRGQSIDPLKYGGAAFQDSFSCIKLKQLINGNGQCTDVAAGQKIFDIGDTSLDNDAPTATTVVFDDRWPVGTKVCYVLSVDKPTQNPTPVDRYSSASCLTIGKQPKVQIWGGDLRVGRYFSDDNTPIDPNNLAKVMTSLTPKADGYTYGSWGEYGVMAPGAVTGFASLSGLAGGYPSNLPNTQKQWSKLTFANTQDEYGLFTSNTAGLGTIPNVKGALLANRDSIAITTDDIAFNGASVPNGLTLYKKATGDLKINTSKLEAGKSVIVYAPEGTVTIADDIEYADGPYSDISEIPQMVIIAKNINILDSVQRITSWLIADNNTAGYINTCSNGPARLTLNACNQPLRIDGPVMAQHLQLRRTAGAAPGDPAEVINLPGSSYLWSLYQGRNSARAQTTLTTELPPYF